MGDLAEFLPDEVQEHDLQRWTICKRLCNACRKTDRAGGQSDAGFAALSWATATIDPHGFPASSVPSSTSLSMNAVGDVA